MVKPRMAAGKSMPAAASAPTSADSAPASAGSDSAAAATATAVAPAANAASPAAAPAQPKVVAGKAVLSKVQVILRDEDANLNQYRSLPDTHPDDVNVYMEVMGEKPKLTYRRWMAKRFAFWKPVA